MTAKEAAAYTRSLALRLDGVPPHVVAAVQDLVAQKFDGIARDASKFPDPLTFSELRAANITRLPLFKDKHGRIVHAMPNGSDWSPAGWLQAVTGELGEYANFRKKFERGDLSFEEYAPHAAKELADVQTYLDILAQRCLDRVERITGNVLPHSDDYWCAHLAHPSGIDLGEATRTKFNEISDRVGCEVKL